MILHLRLGAQMSFSELISPLIGRLALAWFFLSEVYTLAGDWDGQVALLTFANFPAPPVLLALSALLVMTLGGLSLLLGFHARHGAVLLFGSFHRRRNRVDARLLASQGRRRTRRGLRDLRAQHRRGRRLLLVVGMGAGPFSLDNTTGQKKKR